MAGGEQGMVGKRAIRERQTVSDTPSKDSTPCRGVRTHGHAHMQMIRPSNLIFLARRGPHGNHNVLGSGDKLISDPLDGGGACRGHERKQPEE